MAASDGHDNAGNTSASQLYKTSSQVQASRYLTFFSQTWGAGARARNGTCMAHPTSRSERPNRRHHAASHATNTYAARERRDMLLRTALPGWGSVRISASLKLARYLMIAASPRKSKEEKKPKEKKGVTPPARSAYSLLPSARRLPRAASPVLLLLPPLPLLLARHLPPFLNHHPLPNLLCLPTTTASLLRSIADKASSLGRA